MTPRRRTSAQAEPSVKVSDLTALRDRIATKSSDYLRTSKAYKSRCSDGMVIKLVSQSKVLDMVHGWVQELIDGNQADTPAATPAIAEPPAPVVAEDQPGPETDQRNDTDEQELPNQGAGSVDLPSLQPGND